MHAMLKIGNLIKPSLQPPHIPVGSHSATHGTQRICFQQPVPDTLRDPSFMPQQVTSESCFGSTSRVDKGGKDSIQAVIFK